MSLDYTGRTLAELLALEGRYDAFDIVCAVDSALFDKEMSIGLKSAPETYVYAVNRLRGEVFNGGYDQFFRNSSGLTAPFIVDALRAIGAEEVARITERAIAAVGSSDPERIDEILFSDEGEEERDAELGRCDDLYYAYHDANRDALDRMLLEYLKSHRDEVDLTFPKVQREPETVMDVEPAESYEIVRKKITQMRIEARATREP